MFRRSTLRVPNSLVLVGGALVLLLVATALLAVRLSPHPPGRQHPDGLDTRGMPLPPSPRFPLGTDSLGRDVLSRTLHGAGVSLTVGIVAMLVTTAIGTLVGTLAGYFGGRIDGLLMRLTDVMMTLPSLLLAIALSGLMDGRVLHLHPGGLPWHLLDVKLERGIASIFLVIGIVSWTGMARIVRGPAAVLSQQEFVQAARSMGAGHARILGRHVLPNLLPVLAVLATMRTAGAIGLEAGLSYLGVGVPPPAPTWGGMISEGQAYLLVAPWIVMAPGIAVVLAVVGFNILGQGLQYALDPRSARALRAGK